MSGCRASRKRRMSVLFFRRVELDGFHVHHLGSGDVGGLEVLHQMVLAILGTADEHQRIHHPVVEQHLDGAVEHLGVVLDLFFPVPEEGKDYFVRTVGVLTGEEQVGSMDLRFWLSAPNVPYYGLNSPSRRTYGRRLR